MCTISVEYLLLISNHFALGLNPNPKLSPPFENPNPQTYLHFAMPGKRNNQKCPKVTFKTIGWTNP